MSSMCVHVLLCDVVKKTKGGEDVRKRVTENHSMVGSLYCVCQAEDRLFLLCKAGATIPDYQV